MSKERDLTDLAGAGVVEVGIGADGKRLWINIDGVCRFRIYGVREGIDVIDDRVKKSVLVTSNPSQASLCPDCGFIQCKCEELKGFGD